MWTLWKGKLRYVAILLCCRILLQGIMARRSSAKGVEESILFVEVTKHIITHKSHSPSRPIHNTYTHFSHFLFPSIFQTNFLACASPFQYTYFSRDFIFPYGFDFSAWTRIGSNRNQQSSHVPASFYHVTSLSSSRSSLSPSKFKRSHPVLCQSRKKDQWRNNFLFSKRKSWLPIEHIAEVHWIQVHSVVNDG